MSAPGLRPAVQVFGEGGRAAFHPRRASPRRPASASARSINIFQATPAILFRLQSDEWRQTTSLLRDILEDVGRRPFPDRLRALVHAFIQSNRTAERREESGLPQRLGAGVVQSAGTAYRSQPMSSRNIDLNALPSVCCDHRPSNTRVPPASSACRPGSPLRGGKSKPLMSLRS